MTLREDLHVALEGSEGSGHIGVGFLQMQTDGMAIEDFHTIEVASHRTTLGAPRGWPRIVLDGELEIVGSHVNATCHLIPFLSRKVQTVASALDS